MVNVPPLPLVLLFPLIFEPVFIAGVLPLFTCTGETVLPLRPCKVMLFPSVGVTPLPMVKSKPLELKLTCRSVVPPVRVIRTFLPL
jgi:hypothetical protein